MINLNVLLFLSRSADIGWQTGIIVYLVQLENLYIYVYI